jgi:hypothetical protein
MDRAPLAFSRLSTESAALRAAVSAAGAARTKLHLLERTNTALGRSAAIELANFKRLLKANGFSEAEAHTIIPDRSRPAPKAATPPAAPPATPPTTPPGG